MKASLLKASSPIFSAAVLILCLLSCKEEKQPLQLIGQWRFVFKIDNAELPFNAEILKENDTLQFYVINGEERIRCDEFEVRDDSLFIRLPIFNTALIGKIEGGIISGNYFDYSRKDDYQISFSAIKDSSTRFPVTAEPALNVSGKWKVMFSAGSDNEYPALGIFEQVGNRAFGTFLTTTGDYRYLEGNVSGESLMLSCFDGSHVFLFKAKVSGDHIKGDFWSGNHWQESWTGVRDEDFELPDPSTLTFIKHGYSKLDFSFKNINGETVSLNDEKFKNKVVIVQIMGSWCPNCMDETAYLVSLYNQFHEQGLEVVSLAFEKSDNVETNIHSLNKLKKHFEIPYDILLAGKASKTEAAQKLPMLNHVLSFPTSIFIDKEGKVRKIHTGFSGPGTGEYYRGFVKETDKFVSQLLME